MMRSIGSVAEFLGYIGMRLQKSWRLGLAARAAKAMQAGIGGRSGGIVPRAGELYVPGPVPRFSWLRLPGAAPVFSPDEVYRAADVLRELVGREHISRLLARRHMELIIEALGGMVPESGPWIVRDSMPMLEIPVSYRRPAGGGVLLQILGGDEIAVIRRGKR